MICHSCKENNTHKQIKAGCGHLVYVCDDCRSDVNQIRHEKCLRCRDQQTPEEELQSDKHAEMFLANLKSEDDEDRSEPELGMYDLEKENSENDWWDEAI